MNRDEALTEIVTIAKRHHLTPDEIASAFKSPLKQQQEEASSQILKNMLGYLGGILIFAGICIFIAMKWSDITVPSRIMLTLGVGFCLFVMGITCTRFIHYERAATPLFLIAALLQPIGIAVFLSEYAEVDNPSKGVLLVSLIFMLQQGLVFLATRKTVLLFTTVMFSLSFFVAAFDLLEVPYRTAWLVLSVSLLCVTWVINHSPYQAIASLLFFIASLAFFTVTFDIVRNEPYEIFYLGLTCAMIFVAIAAKNRTLLVISTLATLLYIGYFTGKHFPDTLGWPITLIIIGVILILISSLVIKLNQKYITGTDRS
ncbi:DUF2157 domain-containing protein [Legionella erythra]|uniref:DUF2157 domain-containing protein n=1 Tax=Legionella erythra TaxID=448 RepID=A0A0W0TWE8_LEGER|nr:DUF2157 domain-containing protein [Legionella erythra]KTC99972.1 hypothetical protein Lery_0082 [Legionella erythra]